MCVMAPTFMDVRTTQPMNALAKIPGVTTEMLIREMKVEPIKDKSIPHILILQRHIPQNAKAWKEKILRVADMGWLVVSEWDDHPDKLPPGIRERFGEAGWLAFSAAHAVQTSTDFLAENLKKYNENIMIFKNSINCPPFKNKEINKIKIFYGALNRRDDWIKIIDKINKSTININKEYHIVHDREFYDNLETKDKKFYGTVNREEYLKILNVCTHSLLPLEDTFDNRCKSDLKFIESTALSVYSIISGNGYGKQIKNEHFFKMEDHRTFDDLLVETMSAKSQIKLKNAYEYVQRYRTVETDALNRYFNYKKIWNNKKIINEELIKRMKLI